MQNHKVEIGKVLFVQIQRGPLKQGSGPDRTYDPSSLEPVPELVLTPEGVVGISENGEQVLDAHHRDHPDSRFRGFNGISIGFTPHYDRMRARYGEHLPDGIAGENIIAASGAAFEEEDLQGTLIFENPDGTRCLFRLNQAMAPCNEFSHFVHEADDRLPAEVLKGTLQFLGGGRRGFTLFLESDPPGRLLPGAQIFIQRP